MYLEIYILILYTNNHHNLFLIMLEPVNRFFLNMPSRAGQPVPDYAESVNLTLDQIPGTQELTGISC